MRGDLAGGYTGNDGNDQLLVGYKVPYLLEHVRQDLWFDRQDDGIHPLDRIGGVFIAGDRPAFL